MFLGLTIQASTQDIHPPMYEQPIIRHEGLLAYFATKPKVRVEVSVQDAYGRGDRALVYFEVVPNGDVGQIPITLASILPKSEFLNLAIYSMFRSGYEVLRISEVLSNKYEGEEICGYIRITEKDLPLEKEK
jgi:hypothetical protein